MATAFSRAETAAAAHPLAGIDVVILAGGLGTRLRAVLPERQKVVADVAGQPFLARLIGFYAHAGAARIVLALGYRSQDVTNSIAGYEGPCEIVASVEPEPRGTGGALRYALPQLRSTTVLVANGDSFADADLAGLVDLHRSRGASVTLALTFVDDVQRYGRVVVGRDGAVERFEEKPARADPEKPQAGYINAGVYLIEREVVARLPEGVALSLERDVFPELVGHGIYALAGHIPFIDIGTPESWSMADAFFAAIESRKGTP